MFQSTHSLRSATTNRAANKSNQIVSIHALLAECDSRMPLLRPLRHRFNPRTPCGVRHSSCGGRGRISGFNPRTPCGVRPPTSFITRIHKLFQSTHSLRSATLCRGSVSFRLDVSIHALLAECDWTCMKKAGMSKSFNPRTPCGVRLRPTLYMATQQSKSYFAPTSLKRPSLHGCSF